MRISQTSAVRSISRIKSTRKRSVPSSRLRASKWPSMRAQSSAVRPCLSRKALSAPYASSSLTQAGCPHRAASISAVSPVVVEGRARQHDTHTSESVAVDAVGQERVKRLIATPPSSNMQWAGSTKVCSDDVCAPGVDDALAVGQLVVHHSVNQSAHIHRIKHSSGK
eukprot:m.141505 g.141505  ORF g.141505 m.141505 type:complete len:167 (-) comp52602_c0_seq2:13-513(-)